MLRLVTIHVTKGTPAYPVSSRSGRIHVQNSWSGRIRLLKAWFCVIHPSVRGPRTDLEGAPPTTPPPFPPYFFSNKTFIKILSFIYIYIDKSTPTCQVRPDKWQRPKNKWCMSVMSPSTQNYMTSQGRHMSVMASQSAYLFVQQFVKANNKENIKVPRLVTRDSRLKSSKVMSHEWRVGDSWLVTRDLGPPKSPVTSRGSRVGVANSPIVTRDYESRFLLADLNHGSRMNLERCETRIVSCMF